jgi:hypothetical protein
MFLWRAQFRNPNHPEASTVIDDHQLTSRNTLSEMVAWVLNDLPHTHPVM